MILAGDVGGTKTNLGWFEVDGDRVEPVRVEHYENHEHASFGDVLEAFLAGDRRRIDATCLGVAGPVAGDVVDATNLPWELSAREIEERTGGSRVTLINDLVATAEGVPALADDDVALLAEGEERPDGAQLVVAAGTGLGVAFRVRAGADLVACPSEGGHSLFAARDEEQHALAEFLRRRYGRASVERVVSGPGIVDAYEFLATRGFTEDDAGLGSEAVGEHLAERITAAALERDAPRARRAHDLFVSAYGAVTGDLALTFLARGGVWIGGGIAAALEGSLRSDTFREAFLAKGRLREVVERIGVRLIRNPRAALLGAARRAAREATRHA